MVLNLFGPRRTKAPGPPFVGTHVPPGSGHHRRHLDLAPARRRPDPPPRDRPRSRQGTASPEPLTRGVSRTDSRIGAGNATTQRSGGSAGGAGGFYGAGIEVVAALGLGALGRQAVSGQVPAPHLEDQV